MKTRPNMAGRTRQVKFTSTGLGLLAVSVIVAAALLQSGWSAVAQDSRALAELAGRSPGKRIGGVALKGKEKRVAPVRTAKREKPPRGSEAMVLANSVVPEGPVPGFLPGEEVPIDFAAPDIPIEALQQVNDYGGYAPFPDGSLLFFGPFPGGTGPVIGGIPEPQTWLMLIAGFGVVGFGMRRKSRFRALAS